MMPYPPWPPSVSPEGCSPPHVLHIPLQADVLGTLGHLNIYAIKQNQPPNLQFCSPKNAIWLKTTKHKVTIL